MLLDFPSPISGSTLSLGSVATFSTFLTGNAATTNSNKSSLEARFPPNIFTLLLGENFYQDGSIIRFNKTDLIGLTPSSNNTAEAILVGILGRAIQGKNKVSLPKIEIEYWGWGTSDGVRIDTVLIRFFNLATVSNTYEIASYTSTISPNDY